MSPHNMSRPKDNRLSEGGYYNFLLDQPFQKSLYSFISIPPDSAVYYYSFRAPQAPSTGAPGLFDILLLVDRPLPPLLP